MIPGDSEALQNQARIQGRAQGNVPPMTKKGHESMSLFVVGVGAMAFE